MGVDVYLGKDSKTKLFMSIQDLNLIKNSSICNNQNLKKVLQSI